MLALGASESHPESLPCCDSCDSSKCPQSLHFESQFTDTRSRRKRRTAFKDVNEDCKATLRTSLNKAVDEYMESNPSFKMLGRSFVCPYCVIDKICSEARFVQSEHDINFVELRPDLKETFYRIVSTALCNAPNAKRCHRL